MIVSVYTDPPKITPDTYPDSAASVTPAGYLAVVHLPEYRQTLYPEGTWVSFTVTHRPPAGVRVGGRCPAEGDHTACALPAGHRGTHDLGAKR